MGRVRITFSVEYDVEPRDYGVTTMEAVVEEERAALDSDLIGTLASIEGTSTVKVEVV